MIRAIETVYDGYRFRSRLEARWAVFFNALKIPYEYEREGFDLGDVGWYLPDFWLPYPEIGLLPYPEIGLLPYPRTGLWCEIKPSNPTREEWAKVQALAEHTECSLLFQGSPWPEKYTVSGFVVVPPMQTIHGLAFGQNGPSVYLINEDCVLFYPFATVDIGGLDLAFRAARQARFEHGEKPAV